MKIAKKAAVVFCAGLLLISPGVVFQQAYEGFPATLTVNAAATEHDISQGNVTITDSGEYIITGTTTKNTITIEGGNPTVTVKDVSIDLSGSNVSGSPLTVNSTDFTLIIEGENTFKSGSKGAGIGVAGGNKITIKENEGVAGTLNATGANQYSGIGGGGGTGGDGGTIIIESGTVTATGGEYGAGIGGGWYSGGGEVIVKGGTVTATGGEYGAGIGGGHSGGGGTFTIYDGTVTATGGYNGAGIGSGYYSEGVGTFTIYGGTVIANGGNSGAGIGGGYYGDGGTIIIEGGTVTATGGTSAAGIGGGYFGKGGDFTINKGNVTAKAGEGSNHTEDIGRGYLGEFGTAAYNGGTVNGADYSVVAVSYNVEPSYTVEIPATVKLSQGEETKSSITVQDVSLGEGQKVNVKLTAATYSTDEMKFYVQSNNNKLYYTIMNKNEQVKPDDELLSVTCEDGKGTAELTFSAPSDITFAGTYTGTLTFTFSVS